MNLSTLKWGGLAIILVSAFWFGWEYRDRSADVEIAALETQLAQANTKASENAREVERLTAMQVSLAAETEALRNQERETITRTVTQEVIKYVQTPVATQCGPDPDFVRIHDTAARAGSVSGSADSPGQPDESTAKITNADLITVVTGNYAMCHATRDQLVSLQEWVRATR